MSKKTLWDADMPLGRFLSLLTKAYYGALTKKLEHLEIEHYYSILIMIERFQAQNCSQQALCDYLHFDKASMVKRIDYLAKKGLVKRKENPEDRREYCLCLTEKAKKILPDIHQAVEELNEEATKGLTTSQKEEFYNMLWKVYDNISVQPSHKVSVNFKKIK
jgi:MarR family transcriptional regulator, transcriptional regulator for hemolysin